MTDKIMLGKNIRKWRVLRDLKQNDFAKMLNISVSTLSNYENDKGNITLAQLQKIIVALNITFDQLIKDPVELI
ncbi:MAG: helix-turn-helix transcriptional regulator [Ferruginibacter sp.]